MGLGAESASQLRSGALGEFARLTAIETDIIPTSGSSGDQLAQMLRLLDRRASAPDVYMIDVIWTGTLAPGLMDLRPYEDADARSHLKELLANDTVKGKLVALPFYVNIGALYYRTDLLRKYGYDHPPASWDELESMAAAIQSGERKAGNRGFWGYVWQGADYEGLTCNALEWQVSHGGGRMIEADRTITVNNPATARALEMAAKWVGTISPPSVLSYTESDSLSVFRAGSAAFLRHWSGGIPPSVVRGSAIEGRFDLALLPAGPKGRAETMGGFHFAVSRYAAHPEAAARLVVYLTGSRVQLSRAIAQGALPTIPRLYEDPGFLRACPQAQALRGIDAVNWIARPSTVAGKRYREVSEAYSRAVHDVLSRKAPAARALSTLEQRLVELTGFRAGAAQE